MMLLTRHTILEYWYFPNPEIKYNKYGSKLTQKNSQNDAKTHFKYYALSHSRLNIRLERN